VRGDRDLFIDVIYNVSNFESNGLPIETRWATALPNNSLYDGWWLNLDPAGVRIASLVAERAEIELLPTGMTPALFDSVRRKLQLNAWGRQELERLRGRSGSLEPIRAAIASAGLRSNRKSCSSNSRPCLLQVAESMVCAGSVTGATIC
jgi:hypothetical protein